jgi:hypothetical protein
MDCIGIPYTEIGIYNMVPEQELEVLHHYSVRKNVAVATATSRGTENMRDAF